MFDFIEEPMPSQEAAKKSTTPPPLEGMVYTMPNHRTSPPSGSKPGGLMVGLIAIGVVVIGTGAAVWWFVLRQPNEPTPTPIATVPQETTPITATPTLTTQPDPIPTTPVTTTPATPSPTDTPAPSPVTPASLDYVKSLDSDGDDLTDTEERLYGSDALQPDSDNDGHLDGEEVKFLYDPTRPNPAKLETGSSTTLYANPTFKYAMLYPSAWVVDSINKANKEVIFSAATGEFFNLTVQDNPEKLSALDWYTTVYQPNTNTSDLQTMNYDTWSGVMAKNGLEVYMTAKDDQGKVISPYVYVLKYDLGGKKEMNFGSVFQMMIRSFLITDLSFKR